MRSAAKKPRFVVVPILPDLGTCQYCGKLRFSFTNAQNVAEIQRRRQETNHHEYRCPVGHDWHVGSSEVRRPLNPPRRSRPNFQPTMWKEAA